MVEDVDGAGRRVEAAAGDTVGASLRVEELEQFDLASAAVVALGFGRALREELDGGI